MVLIFCALKISCYIGLSRPQAVGLQFSFLKYRQSIISFCNMQKAYDQLTQKLIMLNRGESSSTASFGFIMHFILTECKTSRFASLKFPSFWLAISLLCVSGNVAVNEKFL